MTNLYIPICGFFCTVLLLIIFFSKKRVNNTETTLFSGMLITSFLDSIFMILIIYIAYISKESVTLLKILNKLDYLQFILWISLFVLYLIHVSYKDNQRVYCHYKIIAKIICIISSIACIFILLLPVELYNTNNVMYSYGYACDILYMFAIIYIIFSLITLIINIKKIINHKYIPFYIFVLLAVIVLIMKNINPGLVIITAVLAYVNLIMYFTIENPDIKMLEKMELAKNDADKANRAKSDFLSSMSHEIRTPLNAIVGFSEMIKESDDLDEIHEDAEYVIKASNTLLEIVNGILDISKIESGKLEIVNSPYNSKDLFLEVANLMKPKMREKALDFQISIAEDIPTTLYGDHSNIKKVITNLLSNAYKYTDKGYVKYEVKCINNQNVSRVVISVEDSGRGIKKENIDKLFTKFQRLNEDKNTTIEGTGLGLAITKQIVELMGGKVIVQSVYGSGSKFTIIIDQRIEEVEIKKTEKKETIKIDLTGKKILIVDDNNLNLKVATKLLEKYNPEIEVVDSGFKCIDKVKNNKFDLILLDDMMPKMSGVETLKRLKDENGFNITTIALTANAIDGMKEKYINEGFDDYLAKPIDKAKLKELLIKYLVDNDIEINFGELPKEIYEIKDDYYKEEKINSKDNIKKEVQIFPLEYLKENSIDIDKSLNILGDIDTYNDTLKDFLKNINNRSQKIKEYKNNNDMKNYSIEVHSLKSDAKYLGFINLAEISYIHELKSRDNNIKYINNNYNSLEEELNRIINIIKKYLNM